MTYKNIALSIVMLAVLLLTAGMMLLSFHPKAVISPANELPDAFMEEVVTLILDKQGKPKMKIVTPKMTHFAKHDLTHLEMPQLTIYRQSPQPWYVTSKSADAFEGVDRVDFWDDVTIHHAADQKNPSTLIMTPTLRVVPDAQTADTVDSVVFKQPNLVVKGVGMHADMNTGDIKLLSQARGEYVPSS